MSCNLCGADDYAVVFPKGYAQVHRIVRCNRCGLMYANPQERVDCETFAAEDSPQVYDPVVHRQYFQKQHVQLPDNERALRRLDLLLPQRGRLLEVGCYIGVFLNRIRADGWEATGLEPYRPVADYGRSTYGLSIVDGVLPHLAFKEDEFDAVMMLHVIEHMPNPADSVREIGRILRPGGVLVVETPRFDSLMFRLLGRRERSIHNCQGHIYFFSVPTLKKLLEQNGFEVVHTELVGRTLTLDRLMYNIGLVTRSALIMRWLMAVSRFLRFDKVRLYVNARDMQRMYGRRTSKAGKAT